MLQRGEVWGGWVGGRAILGGSQEAPVAALPPVGNLAPAHDGKGGERRQGWG